MTCDTRIFLNFYPNALKTATRWNKGASINFYGFIDSPACGVMYLNGVNIRITIDLKDSNIPQDNAVIPFGGIRVVDSVQQTFMNFQRYSWPKNYDYTWIVPSKVTIDGVEIDTAGMSIVINVSFAGDTKYNSSSITYQNKIPSNAIIGAIGATPVDVQCQEPCDVVIDITWKNNGDLSGNFTPSIIVSNVRITPHPTQSLAAGATVKKRFTLTGLTAGTYYVYSDPSGQTIPIIVTGIICTPNWQCEIPLNEYENDGCGNRRLNIECNPIIPPSTPPTGVGTGILLIGIGLFTILLFKSKKK